MCVYIYIYVYRAQRLVYCLLSVFNDMSCVLVVVALATWCYLFVIYVSYIGGVGGVWAGRR